MSCLQITQQTRRIQARRKRHKLYARVKKKSVTYEKAAETLQRCKVYAAYAQN
ncbi:hypothetical protein HMPREF3208_00672 [Gardnerella vaginalis]|uniref:Uncharacterized protein n=1 Tax=Gardnerella vaginalis TaxID=2702 RepID=A0A133NXT4_GARVA|nr:hypothetical protein HMPREF3208_00672 [Gardnerella vaginalis]